jgi:hypothetical protein
MTHWHETGTGEFRFLGFLTCRLSSVHLRQTIRSGVASRRFWFASFPLFPLNDLPAVLREGLSVPLEKTP